MSRQVHEYIHAVKQETLDRNTIRLEALLREYGTGLLTHSQLIGRLTLQQSWAMQEADTAARLSELDDVRGVALSTTNTTVVVNHATERLENILNPQKDKL